MQEKRYLATFHRDESSPVHPLFPCSVRAFTKAAKAAMAALPPRPAGRRSELNFLPMANLSLSEFGRRKSFSSSEIDKVVGRNPMAVRSFVGLFARPGLTWRASMTASALSRKLLLVGVIVTT